jgi:hypothetical protein
LTKTFLEEAQRLDLVKRILKYHWQKIFNCGLRVKVLKPYFHETDRHTLLHIFSTTLFLFTIPFYSSLKKNLKHSLGSRQGRKDSILKVYVLHKSGSQCHVCSNWIMKKVWISGEKWQGYWTSAAQSAGLWSVLVHKGKRNRDCLETSTAIHIVILGCV